MRSVGREKADFREGTLQPFDHPIQGPGQRAQFIIGIVHINPLTEPVRRDLIGSSRHGLHRPQNPPSKEIASALSQRTGKQIDFVPRRRNDRFTIDIEDDDIWNAMEYLYERGVVTVNGVDWGKYRQIRRAALEGGKMSVDFNNISVRDALAHLSFLTGLPFQVESGDAEKVISISLREVTLSEIVSRISEQTGVKIKQTEKSASIK